MVAKRICGQVGVVLLAVTLAASLVGAIAPVGPLGSVGLTGPIGTVGAAASGAPSEGTSAPSSAAIDGGFPQVENGSRITFEHTGEGRASYEVTVSGSIEAGPEADLEDAESVDRVSAGRATGSVAEGGADDFFFTGEITSLEVDGPVIVSVDGQQVDPEEIGGVTTTTGTETTTETDTETATTTTTATTATATSTATTTRTETSTPTTASATPTETATTTETPAPTRSRATTPGGGDGGGSTGLSEQERGLFLTVGGVLLLGIIAIGGFALLARR
jgi:hypothetical protein